MLIAIYKSGAKVQLFFEICKDLHKKNAPEDAFFMKTDMCFGEAIE